MARRFFTRWLISPARFIAFLGLLAAGDVQKDTEHGAVDHAVIFALPARGNPSDFIPDKNTEIDLVLPDCCAAGGKRGPYPVAISGMDMGGEIFEGYLLIAQHTPHVAAALIKNEFIRIDVPGPECDPGAFNGKSQTFSFQTD